MTAVTRAVVSPTQAASPTRLYERLSLQSDTHTDIFTHLLTIQRFLLNSFYASTSSVLGSSVRPLTSISCDAISPYLVDGY